MDIKLGRVQGGACVPPSSWRNASPPPNPPQGGGATNKSQPPLYKVQPEKTSLLLMDVKLGKSARGACVRQILGGTQAPPPTPPKGGEPLIKANLPYKVQPEKKIGKKKKCPHPGSNWTVYSHFGFCNEWLVLKLFV